MSGDEGWSEENLFYFFWLPAGKDEFGFTGYEEAPLNRTAFYREDLEQTISQHLGVQSERLRDSTANVGGLGWVGSLAPQDGDLGLRKIQYRFTYHHKSRQLSRLLPASPIEGTAVILSNGLYLWVFHLRYRAGTPSAQMRSAVDDFLRADFVTSHVRRLFDFGWGPSSASTHLHERAQALERYNGILTYYQLNLLYNAVFDVSGHPHLFMKHLVKPELLDAYTLGSLIQSLSVSGFDRRYLPLFDKRKDFSLRGSHPDVAYLRSAVDFEDEDLDREAREQREALLSRLTFAAMEQFLRVAISFGLTHYHAGLDHCRSGLVELGMLARQNRPAAELRRPSLLDVPFHVVDIESYHALMAGKVPILGFLENLVEGVAEVSRPLAAPPNDADATGHWIEWEYSSATLTEARDQFARQVSAISTNVEVIGQGLETARTELILSELTEARKLTEIETEAPRESVMIEAEDWQALSYRLGQFALLLAGIEVYSNIGVWLAEQQRFKELSDVQYQILLVGYWLGVGALIYGLYRYFSTRFDSQRQRGAADRTHVQTHILDYSFLRERVNVPRGTETAIRELGATMMVLDDPLHLPTAPCLNSSSFRETPSSGVERVKYSLESRPSPSKTSYLLHVEVDRRVASDDEHLRDIRLVARVPIGVAMDMVANATQIIASCVQSLVMVGWSEEEVRTFFLERFGWHWPRPAS